MKAFYFKHILKFKFPSGTSRGLLKNKESWFIIIVNNNKPNRKSTIEILTTTDIYEEIILRLFNLLLFIFKLMI